MKHLSHIIKGEKVSQLTQTDIELYKRTFSKVHLSTQKIEEICKVICKHHRENNSF